MASKWRKIIRSSISKSMDNDWRATEVICRIGSRTIFINTTRLLLLRFYKSIILSKMINSPTLFVCTLFVSLHLCSLEITCGPHTGCSGLQARPVTLTSFWATLRWQVRVCVTGGVCIRAWAREMSRTGAGSGGLRPETNWEVTRTRSQPSAPWET